MDLIFAGHANKEIAAHLGISQRTVETHRATVMQKLGVSSLADLVWLEVVANGVPGPRGERQDRTGGIET